MFRLYGQISTTGTDFSTVNCKSFRSCQHEDNICLPMQIEEPKYGKDIFIATNGVARLVNVECGKLASH